MPQPKPLPAGPGQESVWDYPRPPRFERGSRHVQVFFAGNCIADSTRAVRVLETSHPPVFYFPWDDIQPGALQVVEATSFCEFKGVAHYFDVSAAGQSVQRAAWSYPAPSPAAQSIRYHVAFYPRLMDRCLVDGEQASAQPGRFYAGWVTGEVVGPFKGERGSHGW